MQALRRRLRLGEDREAGVSLIEVVVAMFMFALVSAGVLYAMLSVMRITKDSRDRQVAANLAAQEIDLARDAEDLFLLLDEHRTIELNGDTFTVDRSTNWVSNAEVDLPCGAGGGTLRYKRVNVEVTWENMRTGSEPVRADTVIDPNNRINEPGLGTILVSVLGASGTGRSGVTVSAVPASPANGARSLSVTPAATDAQGCSYILKVVPGNYVVTVSKTNYRSDAQLATGTVSVQVTAGTSVSAGFSYDLGGVLDLRYVSDPAPTDVKIPSNLDTSFSNSYGVFVSAASNNSLTRSIRLHPFPSGYNVFAGHYREPSAASDGCISVDPGQWLPGVLDGQNVVGARPDTVAVEPGASLTATIAMGQLTVTDTSGKFLRAVSSDTYGPGDPGCDDGMTYSFAQEAAAQSTIALPYGSWTLLEASSSDGSYTQIAGTRITVVGAGSVSGAVVTLDPRTVPE